MISRNGKHNCSPMSCSIRLLLRKKFLLRDVLPFDTKRACLTYLGRNAVWQAVRILGLNPGDEVLVPAYNCGSEIDPILHHGQTIVPYRVSRLAQIDLKDIRGRVNQRTKAVYVTHYFGFPQQLDDVVRFCRERGLFLVEDCALALFSRDGDNFVGRVGDVAVFSFRKSLPVPDGGAVVVNNPSLKVAGSLEQPSIAPVLAALITSLGRSVERWSHIEWNGIERAYRSVRSGVNRLYQQRRPSGARGEFVEVRGVDRPSLSWQDHYDPKISHWAMSAISRRIIANINSREVVAERRANFQYLLKALDGISGAEPLFQQLPEGACPTVFPLLTERRSELHRDLTRKGVSAIEWWSGYHPGICWDEFHEAVYLKEHIIALPIHHELSRDDVAYIAASVREVFEMSPTDENRARCSVSAVTC